MLKIGEKENETLKDSLMPLSMFGKLIIVVDRMTKELSGRSKGGDFVGFRLTHKWIYGGISGICNPSFRSTLLYASAGQVGNLLCHLNFILNSCKKSYYI